MKILFHHRIGSFDGQAVHVYELVAALREMEHEVIVIGHIDAESSSLRRRPTHVSFLRRVMPSVCFEVLEILYGILSFVRLSIAALRHRPDVIYERSSLFVPVGYWAQCVTGLPVLLEVNAPIYEERSQHGRLFFRRFAQWSELVSWRRANYVLPVSRVLSNIISAAGVPSERVVVIPNGINAERYLGDIDGSEIRRQYGLVDKIVLGFVGFVRTWHKLEKVIEALGDLNGPKQVYLIVVGDSPHVRVLEDLAERLGVGERLIVAGTVERDRIPSYIAAFDIALQPGVTPYASPLKLVEYMALGRAIVAPDLENIRELVTHEDSALLFNPRDESSFVSAVSQLAMDPTLRERLGQSAREAINYGRMTWHENALRVTILAEALTHQKEY